MKLARLTQRGHAHLLMPVVAIAGVAVIGTIFLNLSHAQTPTCTTTTVSQGASGKCVQYIQQMLNGIYARNVGNDTANGINGLGKDTSYGSMTVSGYKSNLLLVDNNFGKVSSTYDANTVNQVKIFQYWVAPGGLMIGTAKNAGPESKSGTVDPKATTWKDLCEYAVFGEPASQRSVPEKDHTPTAYADSYMRAGVSAGIDAGCPRTTGNTVTAKFVQQENTVWPATQTVGYIGVNVPTNTKVTKAEWYLDVNGSYTSEFTSTGAAAPGLYQYNWPLTGLSAGSYRWMVRIYTSSTSYVTAVSNSGNGQKYIDMTVNGSTVKTGTFTGTITYDGCAHSTAPIGDAGCTLTVSTTPTVGIRPGIATLPLPNIVTVMHGNVLTTQPWGQVTGFTSLTTDYKGRKVDVYAASSGGDNYTLAGSTAYYVKLLPPVSLTPITPATTN